MDLKNILGGGVIKYLLIGAISVIIPGLISKFIPQLAGNMLAIALIVIGVFAMGKIPFVPQAMIVAGGVLILGPLLSGLIGSASSAATSSGATF